jgi:hypothetical protein
MPSAGTSSAKKAPAGKKKANKKKAAKKPVKKEPCNDFGLTAFQEIVAIEYLKDLNQYAAWLRAREVIGGMKPATDRTAQVESSKLFQKPQMAARIAALRDNLIERHEITLDRIMGELASIGFVDPAELFDDNGRARALSTVPPRVRAAITGIKVRMEKSDDKDAEPMEVREYVMASKKGALDSMVRMLGGFKDNLNLHGKHTVKVIDLTGDDPEDDNGDD